MSAKVDHPYAGGRKASGVTREHDALVWENMLGTVYASDGKEVRYFDYDWDAARAYAGVEACTDLRRCRAPRDYGWDYNRLVRGKVALFGVRPKPVDGVV